MLYIGDHIYVPTAFANYPSSNMYRAIFLVFLCNSLIGHWVNGDHPFSWNWNNHHHNDHFGRHHGRFIEDNFEHILAHQVIHSDEIYNTYCINNTNSVQEIFENGAYVLIYSPGFATTEVNVQVKHRIINTIIKGNGKEFKDIRLLPNILNIQDAGWNAEDQKVKVVIPYKMKLNVITSSTCEAVNKNTIILPNNKNIVFN